MRRLPGLHFGRHLCDDLLLGGVLSEGGAGRIEAERAGPQISPDISVVRAVKGQPFVPFAFADGAREQAGVNATLLPLVNMGLGIALCLARHVAPQRSKPVLEPQLLPLQRTNRRVIAVMRLQVRDLRLEREALPLKRLPVRLALPRIAHAAALPASMPSCSRQSRTCHVS